MQLHDQHPKRFFTGHQFESHLDLRTARAVEEALHIAAQALHDHRLLTPGEALALAGPEARLKETLFSIARSVASKTDCDQDTIICKLGERYPDFS